MDPQGEVGCGSGTHGSTGYAYAGHESVRVGSGVRATITALRQPSVTAGHAAGWIGLGGKGAGPNGETMWLQTGIAALPRTPLMLYAEITRAGQDPVFLALRANVQIGDKHRLAVLEMNGRPGVWRIWLDGQPVTDPIVLPGSHKRWQPMATAESWNGGVATCNGFSFRFERVGVAARPRRLVAAVRAWLHLQRPWLRRPAAAPDPEPAADALERDDRAVRLRCPVGLALLGSSRAGAGTAGIPRRPRGTAGVRSAYAATILIGVPMRTSLRSARMSLLRRRMQPCETAWPMSHGESVPWTPTTPPPGQSESLE